ncbi:MAG: hypothetical protein NZM65_07800 [Flavobacteriales bacterium]|nr:hypothetical protein [Flavobacteriales bacterium]MDW8410575.1 hypothetical protein [Flavobacteriales bacterium]
MEATVTLAKDAGGKDIFVACMGNLRGFALAVEDIFPQTEGQPMPGASDAQQYEIHPCEGFVPDGQSA